MPLLSPYMPVPRGENRVETIKDIKVKKRHRTFYILSQQSFSSKSGSLFLFLFFFPFETESLYVVQTGFELIM